MFCNSSRFVATVFAVLTACSSGLATAYEFDWGSASVPWPDEQLTNTFTITDGADSIEVTVTVADPDNLLVNNSPELFAINGDQELRIFPDYDNTDQTVTVTFSFERPVAIDTMTLKDLDGIADSWGDGVIVGGLQEDGTVASPNIVIPGSIITVIDSNQYEPQTSGSVGYADPDGWVEISFSDELVTSVTITHYAGELAADDPTASAITISDFTFFESTPVTLTKTATQAGPLSPGDIVNYQIELTNNRAVAIPGIELTDVLSIGQTYQAGSTVVTGFAEQSQGVAIDSLDTGDLSGGIGWTGPWTVQRPANSNLIQNVSNALQLVGVGGTDPFIRRTLAADLSAATSLTLNFELGTSGNLNNDGDTDIFGVYASADGGGSWTQIATYNDEVSGPQSLDITGFASAQTAIRFGVESWVFPANGNNQTQFYTVDDVQIQALLPGGGQVTRDNAVGGNPDLDDGTPFNLVTQADGFVLPANGGNLTATFDVSVDMPSPMGVVNEVVASSTDFPNVASAITEIPVAVSCDIDPEAVEIRNKKDDGQWVTVAGNTTARFNEDYFSLGSTLIDTGVLFRQITIPEGAVVNSATIELVGYSDLSVGTAAVEIRAHDEERPPFFGNTPPTDLTAASVPWTLGAVTEGGVITSPDFAAVVQELVDRYDGIRNANLALVLEGTGTGLRRAVAYTNPKDTDIGVLSLSWGCPERDFGDAPASYGDASHRVEPAPTIYLGVGDIPDVEDDSQHSAAADGDDSDGLDDENGVSFTSPGGTNQSIIAAVDVITDQPVSVCGWLDRPDGSSGQFEAADGFCTTVSTDTEVEFTWSNLPTSSAFTTFARFRVSSDSFTTADAEGAASDGEVEDYEVRFDFTPTSAVIDNFRVAVTTVETLSGLQDVDGGSGSGSGSGSGAGSSVGNSVATGADQESLAQQLAGLAPDTPVAVVQWETLQERGTQGFFVERRAKGDKGWTRLNSDRMLPGLIVSPLGGEYLLLDTEAQVGEVYRYRLIEKEIWGSSRSYGPWRVKLGSNKDARLSKKAEQGEGVSRKVADPQRWGEWKTLKSHYAARKRLANAEKRERRALRRAARQQVNASATAAPAQATRVNVQADGMQQVSVQTLASATGADPVRIERQLRKGRWNLTQQGETLAYAYDRDAQVAYFAGAAISNRETDTAVYPLRRGQGAVMPVQKGAGPGAGVPGSFRDRLVFEENPFLLTYIHGEEDADYGYWDFINTNGRPSTTLTVAVPNPDLTGNAGEVQITLRGVVDPTVGDDQRARVAINGQPLTGEVSWDGNAQVVLTAPFDSSVLGLSAVVDGARQVAVTVTGEAVDPATDVFFMIESVALVYDREQVAVDNALRVVAPQAGVVTVTGFTDPDIRVLQSPQQDSAIWRQDITVEADDSGLWQVSLQSSGEDLLISAAPRQAVVEVDRSSRLKKRRNGTHYLVIAPAELAESAQALADYRAAQLGTSQVVLLQDIYDEFSFGQTDSAAIEAFLDYVHGNWRTVPEYVVLLGRGTLDHADAQGYGESLIPLRLASTPWGLSPADNRYADTNGDSVPEFLLGRISVSDNAEVMAYLQKLQAYEAAPAGPWTEFAMVVADNPDEGGDFYSNGDDIAALLGQAGYAVESLFHPDVAVGDNLLAGWQTGNWALVNYVGHGARSTLGRSSENFFNAADVAVLDNGSRLPVFAALTCGVLDSSFPGVLSVADLLVNRAQGGSIASFAATGLSQDNLAHVLNLAWLDALSGGDDIARAVRYAKAQGYASGVPSYMLDIYNVAGDPAVTLKRSN